MNYLFSKIIQVAAIYTEYLIYRQKPIYGIKPLKVAIEKTRQSKEEISGLHKDFAKLCLKAKCYQHSLSIIDCPVTSFKKSTSTIDILVYNYYKGMLFIGLKKYS